MSVYCVNWKEGETRGAGGGKVVYIYSDLGSVFLLACFSEQGIDSFE